jgi:excisionase family DNA binding protein
MPELTDGERGIEVMSEHIDADDLTIRDPDLSKSFASRFLTKPEAADYLNCSERFVDRLITERRVPFHRFGKFIRLARSDLDSFAAAGRVESLDRTRKEK